jgi:16S rRNA U516 pseudouridylate synthase RsuA-like enzyme
MGCHTLPGNPLSILLTEGVASSQKHGGQTRPVDNLSILSYPSRTTTCVSITISEGKNRQIRRMFHAIGSGVMKLHRISVGEINLGDLKEGEWRLLSEDEVLRGLGYKCRHLDSDAGKERGGVSNSKRKRQ